jgi:hypothetical protein
MGRHHDVHRVLNSTWPNPEAQLNVVKYTVVRSGIVCNYKVVRCFKWS